MFFEYANQYRAGAYGRGVFVVQKEKAGFIKIKINFSFVYLYLNFFF